MFHRYILLTIVLTAVVTIHGNENDCKFKQFPQGSSYVCECSATHCDVIEDYTLSDDLFTVYTSGKRGKRLDKEELPIRNVPFPIGPRPSITLTVDRDTEYQTIFGFGGHFTDATALNLYNLSSATQEKLLRAYFSTDGIEYNFGRVPVASCDASTREYSYVETEGDFELESFELAFEDTDYKIPMIQRANAMTSRPIKLIGSAWAAPGWMKTNGAMKGGGRLFGAPGGQYYKAFANYLVKFLEAYEEYGIDFWALTGGNEPTAGILPGWGWQAMYFGPFLQREFIKRDLGPALHASGYQDVGIIILDDQRFLLPGWAKVVLSDPEAAQYVSGIGLHWYWDKVSDVRRLNDTHELFPDYFMIGTEASEGNWGWEVEVVLGSWERGESYSYNIIENFSNWMVGWIDWNMILNMIGGPNWVDNFVDCPIIVNAEEDVFYKQPMYYHLGHFSKFIVPDSKRVRSTNDREDLVEHLAFKLPDGNMAVVVMNRKEFTFPISIYDPEVGYMNTEIPSRSIQTYIWKSPTN